MFARRPRVWGLLPIAVTGVIAGAVALPSAALAATAAPSITYTNLTLIHGWQSYGLATPGIADISGVVHFRGAISTASSNINLVPFVLPKGFRPGKFVSLPVDMCNATPGEMFIAPNGVTQVFSEGAHTNATCFTSLDGVSFAPATTSFTLLKLQNGWKEFGNLYRKAAVTLSGGFVRFAGEIRPTGKSLVPFTLPAKFRPSTTVHILINLCSGEVGQLEITPKGVASITAEDGNSFAIKCGTSLEGAVFAQSPKSFTPLTLSNGWKTASGVAKAAARVASGIVYFRGAIKTSGTNADPFTLPAAFRPHTTVYVSLDLCDGDEGRFVIEPSGFVGVESENSDFAQAQCLTSLDGVSFSR